MTRHLPDPLAATILCLLTALATVAALAGLARAEETESRLVRATRAVLESLPVAWVDRDEDPELRRERLAILAAELAAAAEDRADWDVVTSAGIEIAWAESRLARYVADGRCEDGPEGSRCDIDPATGIPRARGYFQQWKAACPLAYEHPAGSRESLQQEARCVVRLWSAARVRCRGRHPAGEWAGAFSGYRSVDCRWPLGKRRAEHMATIRRRLVAAMAAGG